MSAQLVAAIQREGADAELAKIEEEMRALTERRRRL